MNYQQPPPGQYPPGQYPPPGQQYPPQGQYMPPGPQGQYPGQMPGQMPGQYGTQNAVYMQAQSGTQILQGLQGIFIKQKFEALEAVTGCETPNVYRVFAADANGQKTGSNPLFKCKEKSGWYSRNCLPGDCRPFEMKVQNEMGQVGGGGFEKSLFLQLERPFKCTCCCLARPILDVSMVESGSAKQGLIGRIYSPCLCCSLGVEIQDSQGNLRYSIMGTACQQGVLCKGFPCESCQTVFFELLNPEGNVISHITKKTPGCLKAMVSDATNFSVSFPQGASVEDKALIMAATLFMDYMFFEESPQDNKQSTYQADF